MQLSDMIEVLTEHARELNPGWELGDEMPNDPNVKVAYQPSWPLEENVSEVQMLNPLEAFFEEYGHATPEDEGEAQFYNNELAEAEAKTKTIYFACSGSGGSYLAAGMSHQLGWR